MFKRLKQKVFQMKYKNFYPALSKLEGRVLEIGFGDGESFSYYSSDCEIFALEKSYKKIQAQKNSPTRYRNVKFFKSDAESLPFEEGFFDAVVVSFVLCSVNSLNMVMREIERVLRPGGKFILLEHIRSENGTIARFQDIFSRPYSWITKNCHPNRNPLLFINNSIFRFSNTVQIPYILGRIVFAQANKNKKGRGKP